MAADAPAEEAPPDAVVPGEPEAPVAPAADAPAAEAAAGEPPAQPAPQAAAPGQSPPKQKRRRRPTAAERHRRVFFARLNELRGGPRPGPTAETHDPATAAAPDPAASDAPAEQVPTESAEEQATVADGAASPVAEPEAAEVDAGPPDLSSSRDQARLAAAIERVGGPAVIRQALAPKRDAAGKPLKWAAVCCEAAQGLKSGDPVFAAWVRLAATPVREIKARVPDERPERGRGRGGPGRHDDRGRGGPRNGRRDERDSGRASREDMKQHAFGGRVGAKIVIPGFEPPQQED